MTEQEAIKSLKEMFPKGLCEKDEYEMSQKAINALEEVEQYRAIGTPEECRAAVEKQIPKKITHPGCFDNEGVWHTWNGIDGVPYDLCPNCETNLCTDGVFGRDKKKMKYCENCGQKLDFGE